MSNHRTSQILIVDNDPAVLRVLESRLAGMGYGCVTATSGAQALASFRPGETGLVISDLNMPQGDGASLAAAIRRNSDVPILLISGFKDAYRREMRNIPDVMFLHKPFETRDLVDIVRATIGEPDGAVVTHGASDEGGNANG